MIKSVDYYQHDFALRTGSIMARSVDYDKQDFVFWTASTMARSFDYNKESAETGTDISLSKAMGADYH